MIQSGLEDFKINKCPICGRKHLLTVDVYRDYIPNDINKDVRVPEFRKVKINVVCPRNNEKFGMEIMLQEDVYSKITKIRRV
ncbi:MAG TPA: hypothetical protein PK385_03770 [Spirochaetota bacterium]|mgnify:FL=1|nr:hypothetical protein [Spirochaetota bacterium]HOS31937.1 hypothetical protein [Spirochaetota bacterium]HOS55156.1 hypothetical protein [Spirochaetota bacterium]HPK61042.1 hypothetical protein [Spirochaetota bacterium]HQF77017.1 hypothetical protein [Spirochaetota bacterium]